MNTEATSLDEHYDALRAWAKGMYPLEAATELLIRTGWAHPARRWIEVSNGRPYIDFLTVGDPEVIGSYSGGEKRLLRIIASLSDRTSVVLGDDISGLDRKHVSLILAAIAHASGSHQDSEMIGDPATGNVTFEQPGSLYPWPEG